MNHDLQALAAHLGILATVTNLGVPCLANEGRPFICQPDGQPPSTFTPEDVLAAKHFAASFFPIVYVYDAEAADRFITATTFLTHAELKPADASEPPAAAARGGAAAISQVHALAVCGRLNEYHPTPKQDADKHIRLGLNGHRHQVTDLQTVYCRISPTDRIPSQPRANLIAGRLDGRSFWTIQYYMLQFFNDAPYSELYSAFKDKELDHEGDWLCVQVTVEQRWDGQYQLVDVTMQNHERVLLAMPGLLPEEFQPVTDKTGVHPQIWIEAGCHEPYPFSGSHGLLKKPTGVYYAKLDEGDHNEGQRDYPLAHSGQQKIAASDVEIVVLANTPDARSVEQILKDVEDVTVANRLDPIVLERYSGLYGGNDNSPQGPDWREGRWRPGCDVDQWSYGQIPADDVPLAEWYHWLLPGLDAMREYFNTFEDNWLEGVALFPAFCAVAIGTVIFAVVGGVVTLWDMSFGDDWGGDGSGGDGGPDENGNIPPLTKGDGRGWSISQEGSTLYARRSGDPKQRVCAVPVLTEEGETILRIKEAEAIVVDGAQVPSGIRFTALGPTTPPKEKGPEFDCWLFMDGWPRACRPTKTGAGSVVIAPLPGAGAAGQVAWEVAVSADGKDFLARRAGAPAWSRVCPVPQDPRPDVAAGLTLTFAQGQDPTGVCFVCLGDDRETLHVCDADGRVSRHGVPRIFADPKTLGSDLRVEVENGQLIVGRPDQDNRVWSRAAALPKGKAGGDMSYAQGVLIDGVPKVLLQIGDHYFSNASTSVLADETEFDEGGKPVIPPEILALFRPSTSTSSK